MKKYIVVEDKIDIEMLEKIAGVLSDKEVTQVKIYFRSAGGTVSAGLCLIDMLKENKERVEVVCSYEISSMAAPVVMLCECKITIIPECTFLIHKMRSATTRLLKDGKHVNDFDFISDTKCEFQDEYDKLMKSLLTPKQCKLYDSGKDVVLDSATMRSRLLKILSK